MTNMNLASEKQGPGTVRPKLIEDADAVLSRDVEVMPATGDDDQDETDAMREESKVPDGDAVDGEAITGEANQDDGVKRILPDPGQPTERQREEHRVYHWPYRSWCKHCVEGRCTGEHHRGVPDERKTYPMLCFDYLFFTKNRSMVSRKELVQNDDIELKVLVAKERVSKTIFAHAVEAKGSDVDGYAVGRLVDDVKWLGWTKLSLKSDNENAIVKVLRDTLTTARVEIPELEQIGEEHGAKYDSASNGEAENAVKQVQRMTRTLKLC